MQNKNENQLTFFAVIGAVTLLFLTYLIINLEGRFDANWSNKNGFSLTIESRRTSEKINDYLPSLENSHRLNRNIH